MKGYIVKGIGKNLQKCRERAGLTQEQVAERAEISVNYLSAVEREVKSPTLDTFVRLINVIEVTPNEVMESVITTEINTYSTRIEERISKLPAKKQKKLLRILDTIVEEFDDE